MLYMKHGRKMRSMRSFFNGRYYIYEVDGKFVPSDSLGWFVTYDYYSQWVNTLSARAYKPKNGDVILDIGAGIGEETLIFSQMVGEKGKIYSIEANNEVFKVLEEVVQLNKLPNVILKHQAISFKNEPITLNVSNNSFLGGSIGLKDIKENQFTVDGTRMDTFIQKNKIQQIDLLKTNIEGAERFVIGSLDVEIKKIRNVAISCHDFRYRNEGNDFFKTRGLVETYLQDNHFELLCGDPASNGFPDWVYGVNKY